jgi:multidrug resistance efflux pump
MKIEDGIMALKTINDYLGERDDNLMLAVTKIIATCRMQRDIIQIQDEELEAKAAAYDAARADHATECIEFAEILEREGYYNDGRVYRAKAAALAAPADGSADADADAADGSVLS